MLSRQCTHRMLITYPEVGMAEIPKALPARRDYSNLRVCREMSGGGHVRQVHSLLAVKGEVTGTRLRGHSRAVAATSQHPGAFG
jgi:hypothetical protein